jgi:YesN/AraC family two-component response regulator
MNAHQYLSKPTDQEDIISLMNRVTDLLSLRWLFWKKKEREKASRAGGN